MLLTMACALCGKRPKEAGRLYKYDPYVRTHEALRVCLKCKKYMNLNYNNPRVFERRMERLAKSREKMGLYPYRQA